MWSHSIKSKIEKYHGRPIGEAELLKRLIIRWRQTFMLGGMGGIPECDLRETQDGVIVCLHDDTLARTSTAPDAVKDLSVSTLRYDELRKWDAGIKFDTKYQGEKIPSIEEVFVEASGRPERQVYLDLKKIDLQKLGKLIDIYQVNRQVIFAHNVQDNCIMMKAIASGVRSMQWIGGKPEQIKEKFDVVLKSGFNGLDQVQIHLNPNLERNDDRWLYEIDVEFLNYVLKVTKQYGVDCEVLPFEFDQNAINQLLDMGIDWYATDEPARFLKCLNHWKINEI